MPSSEKILNASKNIFLQMIPVIFGILIALLIGNYKENMDDRRFVKKILITVGNELRENEKDLNEIIAEHNNLLDTINKYIKDKNTSIGNILSANKGLRMINIQNNSWKAFLSSNLEIVDYKKISLLTRIDESRENMRILEGKIVDFIYENLSSTDGMKKTVLKLMIHDLQSMESGLLQMHNQFFELNEDN